MGVRVAPTQTSDSAEAPSDGGSAAEAPPATERQGLSDWALLAITALVTVPVLWMGYGTDLDVGDVRAVGALIRDGDYQPSRNPGVPVFEAIVGLLDPIGGHVAVNLASAAAAGVAVVGIARLVRAWGKPN